MISYTDISSVRVLHYGVSVDYVDDFVQMIKDTFVHPSISFTDIIYSIRYRDWETDRKSTRLNSSHSAKSRMPSSA